MRKIEFRRCRKCGQIYTCKYGGIVPQVTDFSDFGMCSKCRVKELGKSIKKLLKGKDGYGQI